MAQRHLISATAEGMPAPGNVNLGMTLGVKSLKEFLPALKSQSKFFIWPEPVYQRMLRRDLDQCPADWPAVLHKRVCSAVLRLPRRPDLLAPLVSHAGRPARCSARC